MFILLARILILVMKKIEILPKVKLVFIFILFISVVTAVFPTRYYAMPFYNLKPDNIVLRSSFFTSYGNSCDERKHNIELSALALDNTFVDVNGEFSFNAIVGPRTSSRGYKTAKIIFNGQFIDGVGGGVCQVSTTLYNALLLGDLKITEYHPHSLPVSYVALSFDAMVNSGSADLRFINNTHNPIIIKAKTDGVKIKISIFGEPPEYQIERESVLIDTLPPPPDLVKKDADGEYPDLYVGQSKIVNYGKNGFKSQGYLIKKSQEKPDVRIKIRTDEYAPLRGLTIEGTAAPPI